MPKRIRLSRAPGWRIAEHSDNYVIVDRRSKWGNPFRIESQTTNDGKRWYVSGLNTPRTYTWDKDKARASGFSDEGGGWATHEATGQVVQVNRVTVDIKRVDWNSTRRVPAERIVDWKA